MLDARTRRAAAQLEIPARRRVVVLRYSADGGTLSAVLVDFSTDQSQLVRFDPRTGRRLGPPADVTAGRLIADGKPGGSPVNVTSDGRRLVVDGPDETIVRDADSAQILRRIHAAVGDVTASELSPDDRTLAVGGDDGSLRLVDLRAGRARTAVGPRGAAINSVAFTPDGRSVITGNVDGQISRWDVGRAKVAETLTGHAGPVRSFAITSDGKTLYSGGLDRSVFAWDLGGTRRLGRPFRAGSANVDNPRYAMSADGRLIAAGQNDGAVSVVDARTLEPRMRFQVITAGYPMILGIGFVPGSHRLVVGSATGFLALADADSGRVLRRLRGAHGWIWTPGISADGRLLVTGGNHPIVRFWSLPDGRPLGPPLRFRQAPRDVQLSPDGRWVTVAFGSRLEIWDARTRRRARSVTSVDGIDMARFSPDGRLLAVTNPNGAQVWSTEDWTPVTRVLSGHAGPIYWVTISRDNRTLATSSLDGTVRLWDIKSEQAIGAPLPGLPGHGVIGMLTPDGDAVVAGYDTGQAYRWDIRAASLVRQACGIAGRTLTRAEWDEFLPGRDYEPACSA